ncbi:Putative HMP/thiamine-binding protein YkoF [Pseudooceanicola marinus]|uniref:Putative HMP/thiamine-binding protein YkoF n=1 Tax=Pseudooceanicola marinus TaxID=396013 RepID=A0A1X6Y6A7_9RHOB|nr:YkoF family thiamine/hydroxymethylpyrimidine-binding protein [Pseudooceanicola marinus]PJE33287.1 HMP/thiamine-binding protein [Pseudooceanicola marinus]SLN11934.1 Putative HMP/thiamine-binding protein YkoF [Pseudooceanicola marinus]
MFIGAQVSLYPMTSDFVDVVKSGLTALTPYTDDLRIETDDMSTLMVGAPEPLLDAIRDLFAEAARRPEHVTMHVTLSRGCPGEPDDPSCHCEALVRAQDLLLEDRKALASEAVAAAPDLGVGIDVQFSLYVLGQDHHMDEIYGCIDFLKASGTFLKSKNFCTRLRGDAGAVFETLRQAFLRFGPAEGHVTIDLTASANSPSLR